MEAIRKIEDQRVYDDILFTHDDAPNNVKKYLEHTEGQTDRRYRENIHITEKDVIYWYEKYNKDYGNTLAAKRFYCFSVRCRDAIEKRLMMDFIIDDCIHGAISSTMVGYTVVYITLRTACRPIDLVNYFTNQEIKGIRGFTDGYKKKWVENIGVVFEYGTTQKIVNK